MWVYISHGLADLMNTTYIYENELPRNTCIPATAHIFFCFYAYTSASLENKSKALDLATSMKHSFSSVIFLWRSCIKAHLRSCHINEGSRFLCFLFYYSGCGVSTWRSLFIKSISLECPAAITPTKALSK